MKILLVNPPSIQQVESIMLPLGIGCVATYLKANSHVDECRLLDLNLYLSDTDKLQPYYERLKSVMKDYDPDVVGFTTICNTFPHVLEFARLLKKDFRALMVLGGPQATLTATQTLREFEWIDYIVKHEGEETFSELIDVLSLDLPLDGVKGVVHRYKDSIIENDQREFIEYLDDTPILDYSLLNVDKYKKLYCNFSVPVEVGRACPYDCHFCSTSVMWRRQCRMKTPKRVLLEMDQLKRDYGLECFKLIQDNFTTSSAYVDRFCDALMDVGYKWECNSRCDTITEEMIEKMKRAGCYHIFYGVESASPKIQKSIGKNLQLTSVDDIIVSSVRNDISFTSSYIIGFPDESVEDIKSTLMYALRDSAFGADRVLLNVLAPLPGTAIYAKYAHKIHSPLKYRQEASPALFATDIMEAYVRRYQEVFSSYYFIEHDALTIDELCQLQRYAMHIIDHYPRTHYLQCISLGINIYDLCKYDIESDTDDSIEGIDDAVTTALERHMSDDLVKDVYQYERTFYSVKSRCASDAMRDLQSQDGNADFEKDCLISPYFETCRLKYDVLDLIGRMYKISSLDLKAIQSQCDYNVVFVSEDDDVSSYYVDPKFLQILDYFRSPRELKASKEAVAEDLNIAVHELETVVGELLSNGLLLKLSGGKNDKED
jgi:radical SAM superfamily enzyme YgiQ (UPF0313 family)